MRKDNTMKNLAGKLVKIYQDPLTERDFEGIAKVAKIYDSYPIDGQVMYEAEVVFQGEESTNWRRFTENQILK
jgi:hypothetical protein